jgi:hypothetical protein
MFDLFGAQIYFSSSTKRQFCVFLNSFTGYSLGIASRLACITTQQAGKRGVE